MTTILGIAGSLRRDSFNRTLLAAAAHELPAHMTLRVWDDLAQIPAFDEDTEHAPAPSVAGLRRAIADADGLLIATPEYNGSIPGQLKNAVDWASRPRGESALIGKPAVVIGASVTPHGAAWAQQHLHRSLGIAGAAPVDGHLPVPEAFRQFDENGRLLDVGIRAGLHKLIAGLDTHIRTAKTAA